jgi:hypothetical protein
MRRRGGIHCTGQKNKFDVYFFHKFFCASLTSVFRAFSFLHLSTYPSPIVMSEASKDFRATFDPEKQSIHDNDKTAP